MKFFSYLRVELNRIFHSKIVYMIMVLTMLCPMAGYKMYKTTTVPTLAGSLIANPTVAGALGGGILFALLTLLEFDRVRKYQTASITNSIVSPLVLNVLRLIAILVAAIIGVSAAAALYFPYTFLKMRDMFEVYTYLNSFFLLMMPSVLLSILVVSALYQIFGRVDLSIVLFLVAMLLSFSKWFEGNNIIHWINPSIPTLSDDFSNRMLFRLMQTNRLFWFLVFCGLWLIGLLCVRRYGKGMFASILHNLKKAYIPGLVVLIISSSYYVYNNQPYVYDGDKKDNLGELNTQVELSNTDFEISFDTSIGSISGKATYSLQNSSGSPQECILAMSSGYTCYSITANGEEITFEKLNNAKSTILFTIPNDPKVKLTVEYDGIPKVVKNYSDDLIDTTIVSDKYINLMETTVFYPSLRVGGSKESSQVTGQFTIPDSLVPVLHAAQLDNKVEGNTTDDTVKLLSEDGNNKTWVFHTKGNSLLTMMAADYAVKKLGDESMPVEFYYSRKVEDKMKNMNSEKIMQDTIDYATAHYGKLHNVSKNNPLKVIQNTAFLSGGYAFQNFSTMEETDFSDENLGDKSKGASYAEVLAHEISHQWWGAKCDYSAEALAVYTTYRVAKEKYGDEYAQKNYVDEWKKHVKEDRNNFYSRYPEYLDLLPEKYTSEINDDRLVVRQYSEMPLEIFKATELVGGEANMDKILAKLYDKTKTGEISWQDFLDECNLKEEDLTLEQII